MSCVASLGVHTCKYRKSSFHIIDRLCPCKYIHRLYIDLVFIISLLYHSLRIKAAHYVHRDHGKPLVPTTYQAFTLTPRPHEHPAISMYYSNPNSTSTSPKPVTTSPPHTLHSPGGKRKYTLEREPRTDWELPLEYIDRPQRKQTCDKTSLYPSPKGPQNHSTTESNPRNHQQLSPLPSRPYTCTHPKFSQHHVDTQKS